jgi:SulP family sulfate permease
MSRADAAAFLVTAGSVLAVNAVLAVALGCSIYAVRAAYVRWVRPTVRVPGFGEAGDSPADFSA